ncbi:uncharacterized protein LOC109595057 isoform X2 [Aethina tumida]|nr:uncharacterized protein LOC109595057 isoform X2 [Aethina tumida]
MWGIGVFISLSVLNVICQEDSLRSALNAIDRRQEEYPRYEDGEYGYPMDRPDDLSFIKAASDYNSDKESMLEHALYDYLDDQDQDDMKKRISSSFRERVEEDRQKQIEELARNYLANLENEEEYENENGNYEDLIRELWEKYRRYPQPSAYSVAERNKRYYPQFGIGESMGLRKRNRYYSSDTPTDSSLYLMNYVPREDVYNRLQEDSIDNSPYKQYRERRFNKLRQHGYQQIKRFPVTKRSSDYLQKDKPSTTKPDAKKETDPKVAKELSNVFGLDTTTTTTAKPTKNNKKEHIVTEKPKKTKKEKEQKPQRPEETKEVALPSNNEKPLQIKKKSIDWSDYFGLDRRKKAEAPENLNNEWLIERYHKAIAMASKRNAELPLQSFKNHDMPDKKESADDKVQTEEERISEMDTKLKNMEDTIVDDALKYTGAHEGATDSKEVQEVKNKVIARLAAAYSLEKMRNALGEYKLAVAKERERLKQQRKAEAESTFQEEKRTSVARKQAVDERKNQEMDNNIKCTQGNTEECLEQNYGASAELLEHHFGQDE